MEKTANRENARLLLIVAVGAVMAYLVSLAVPVDYLLYLKARADGSSSSSSTSLPASNAGTAEKFVK